MLSRHPDRIMAQAKMDRDGNCHCGPISRTLKPSQEPTIASGLVSASRKGAGRKTLVHLAPTMSTPYPQKHDC